MPTSSWSFFEDPTQYMEPADVARALQVAKDRAEAEAAEQKKNRNRGGGPRTPEGKAISSQNALKHGFASANPVIPIENREAYQAHLDAYFERFQPADQPEADTVRRAAIAMWKHDRMVEVEAKLFELEFEYHRLQTDAVVSPDTSPIHRMAIAFKESAGAGAFDLCRRYLMAASRDHDRAMRTFYFLVSQRQSPKTAATAATPPQQSAANTRKTPGPNELPRKAASVTAIGAKPAVKPAPHRPSMHKKAM